MTELLRCPFCGDTAATCEGDGKWFVACCNMGCFCAVGEGYDPCAMPNHVFTSEEAAIEAWNTRAAEALSANTILVTDEMVERHSRFVDPLFWKVIEEFPGAGAEQLRGTCLVKSREALTAALSQSKE